MALSDDREMVNIGRLSAAVGLKGELRVTLYAGDSENLHEDSVLHVETKDGVRTFCVQRVRYQKDKPIVLLEGIADRNAAEALRGLEIYIHEDDLAELPEGEYYFRDLIGLRVYDRASDAEVGFIEDIIDNPAQNIYVVRKTVGAEAGGAVDSADGGSAESAGSGKAGDGGTFMIPAVDAFVKEVDLDAGFVYVELIPGLM